jgi:hypothetical protein
MNNTLSQTQLKFNIPAGIQHTSQGVVYTVDLELNQLIDHREFLIATHSISTVWLAGNTREILRLHGAPGLEKANGALKMSLEQMKSEQALLKLEIPFYDCLSPTHLHVIGRASLPANDQFRWAEIAINEKLSPAELRTSIIKGEVTRAEVGGGRESGVGSPHAVRQQFDFWMREIEGRWETLPPDQLEALHAMLRPIAEFVLRLEQKMAAGEEARAPFNEQHRVVEKIRFHFALGSEVSIGKIQRKLRLGYNAASAGFDALVESGEVKDGIRVPVK